MTILTDLKNIRAITSGLMLLTRAMRDDTLDPRDPVMEVLFDPETGEVPTFDELSALALILSHSEDRPVDHESNDEANAAAGLSKVAIAFNAGLRLHLGAERYSRLIAGGGNPHDVCDANEVAISAFRAVFGFEPGCRIPGSFDICNMAQTLAAEFRDNDRLVMYAGGRAYDA